MRKLYLVILIVILVCLIGGCAHLERQAAKNQKQLAFAFFKSAYEAVEIENITPEQKEKFEYDFAHLEADFRKFVQKEFPFVNLTQPSLRDLKFLGDDVDTREGLEIYWEWSKIDPKNLTEEQQELLDGFNSYLETEEIEEISNDDREEYSQHLPWIDPDNLTVRDKIIVWLIVSNIYIM